MNQLLGLWAVSLTLSIPTGHCADYAALYQGNRNLTPVKGSYTVPTDYAGNPGALLRTSWVHTIAGAGG
jgi:hypothetical protein